MQEIRDGLETLPIQLVKKYADPKKTKSEMSHRRIQMQREYLKQITGLDYNGHYDFQIGEILRAIKNLPIEQVQCIADYNYSLIELKNKIKQQEKQFITKILITKTPEIIECIQNMSNQYQIQPPEPIKKYTSRPKQKKLTK